MLQSMMLVLVHHGEAVDPLDRREAAALGSRSGSVRPSRRRSSGSRSFASRGLAQRQTARPPDR